MRRKTHILVIDSEGLTRDGLCALLKREDGLSLAPPCASVREALRAPAGEPAPESAVRLPVELIVRDSCGGRGASTSPPDLTSSGASPAHPEKQKEDS